MPATFSISFEYAYFLYPADAPSMLGRALCVGPVSHPRLLVYTTQARAIEGAGRQDVPCVPVAVDLHQLKDRIRAEGRYRTWFDYTGAGSGLAIGTEELLAGLTV